MKLQFCSIFCLYLIILSSVSSIVLSKSIVNQDTSLLNTDGNPEYWGVIIEVLDPDIHGYVTIYDSLISSDNWNESHVIHLVYENATRSAILQSIDWLINCSDADDIVLFAINAHGFFSFQSHGIVSWQNEPITIEEFDEKFDQIDAEGICLLFDSCHSGSFVEKNPMRGSLGGENRDVLMSTKWRGLGTNWYEYDGGELITISLLNSIGEAFSNHVDYNNDTICSAEEAYSYAQKRIFPFALQTFLDPLTQIISLVLNRHLLIPFPTLYDNYSGDLPLIHL
jgi:hypothetical protein